MSDSDELRLYLIWRTDIEIPYEKALIQSGHAYTNILRKARTSKPERVAEYESTEAQPKIVLNGKNLDAMARLQKELDAAELQWYQVTDFARTVFTEPTVTCMAVGPMRRNEMTPFMKRLQLLEKKTVS